MSQSNRSSPSNSPFPFKKVSLSKTSRNPSKFFTIHSFQNPNPQAKPSSILLTEDNVSVEQESTYPSTSLRSSRESVNTLNTKMAFSPDRTMQKFPLFEIKDSIYELPSHKITPIASLSDLDGNEELESIDIERRNIVNDIKISLQAIHERKSSNMHKANTCRVSPSPVGGNISPGLAKNTLPVTSLKNIKGRSYAVASNVQYQYSRHATTSQDMEYYFSNNMSQKSLKSQKSKPVSLNKFSFAENVPSTARMMTSNLLKGAGKETAFNNIVFEPPKPDIPKSFTARMKLKEYLRPDMKHTPILIKTLDEQLSSSRGREMVNANKPTTAWSVKYKSSALLSNSPLKPETKVKANSQSRILL